MATIVEEKGNNIILPATAVILVCGFVILIAGASDKNDPMLITVAVLVAVVLALLMKQYILV
jgi:hypothetical protein